MIEIVALPLDAGRSRMIAFPVSDLATHALVGVERNKRMEVVGHEKEEVVVPVALLLIVEYAI
ncbi:MAG TPA: hypothetical protein DIV79_12665 [Opitutae bacterium]|nr:hypothetical protein [Opitutaceae bacterium]HCR30858.1 hypothetical protein [Opitutae bacterium]